MQIDKLNGILNNVLDCCKVVLDNKLVSVILYGSYARGDYDDESDLDILIEADIPNEKCLEYSLKIASLLSDTELENDIVIAPNIVSASLFRKYSGVSPFYKNVISEGIKIAG